MTLSQILGTIGCVLLALAIHDICGFIARSLNRRKINKRLAKKFYGAKRR